MRSTRRDLLLLAALCAVVYATGLTTHGLANWQEAQRVVVAREMQERGNWLVPTINGRPYLAKPPMIYRAQLALADLFGRRVGIFELRLTVAIAGLLGVLATYLVTLRLMRDGMRLRAASGDGEVRGWGGGEVTADLGSGDVPRQIALWSSLCLATGFLYSHSARVGELDILLVPFVVVGIGAIAAAWRAWRQEERTNWSAITVATLCATGATMTKGPPGLLVIVLAGYGGIAAWCAHDRSLEDEERGWRWRVREGVALVFLAAAVVSAVRSDDRLTPGEIPGIVIFGIIGWLLGAVLEPMLEPARARACWRSWAHTHPVIVIAVPLVVLWAWNRLAATRLGGDAGAAFAQQEAEDNLWFFASGAPSANLTFVTYGVALGSVAMLLAVFDILRRRERSLLPAPMPRTASSIVLAWAGLGLAAFSVLGKGVARYLTPVWPAIAIIGGAWIVREIARSRRPQRTRAIFAAIIVSLAGGETYWYAIGRNVRYADRSPRDLVGELLAPGAVEAGGGGIRPEDLATFEFRTPAVDYYAGRFVQPIGEVGQRDTVAGTTPWTIEDLKQHLAVTGRPMVVLVRMKPPPEARDDLPSRPAIDRLAEAGLTVQTLPVRSRFTLDNGRTPVGAVRVELAPVGRR